MRTGVLLLILALGFTSAAKGSEPAVKKVLLIGIDGCRFDALMYSQAKHLKELASSGAYSDQTDVLGDRKTGAATITGPGWSSAVTGVWADKHGVRDNSFRGENLAAYPSFLQRLTKTRPDASAIAVVSWNPFQKYVFNHGETCRFVLDGDRGGYAEGDRQVTKTAETILAEQNPDILFAYFGEVDVTGHGYGFHPRSPKYTNAIEAVDEHVGKILTAMRARSTFAKENWLVMVCTDHGGQGRDHGLGEKVPEIRNGFMILNGPAVRPGKIDERTFNVDVAVTALTHLGVAIQPDWKLDGHAVGLR